MKKSWWVFVLMSALVLVVVTTSGTDSKIKILIDGQAATNLQPRLEQGQVIVCAPALAQAMKANFNWDSKTNTLKISRFNSPDEVRGSLLEYALRTKSPEATAQAWAQAVQTRNGAWQYSLLSPDLQAKSAYSEGNWVTGSSSPWVEAYQVTPYHPEQSKAIQYQVDYHLTTSTGWAGHEAELLTITNQEPPEQEPHWVVTARQSLPSSDLKSLHFDNHSGTLGDFIILSGLPIGWELKTTSGQLRLVNQQGLTKGTMELIGGKYLPNHSEPLQQIELNGVYGKGEAVWLRLSQPAASGSNATEDIVLELLPMKNNFWLQLTLPTTKTDIESNLNLARDIAQTIIAFPNQ